VVPGENEAMPTAEEPNMTIEIEITRFRSMHDAVQWSEAAGGEPVLLDGKPAIVSRADADRLAAAGVPFAYLVDHEMPDGEHRIMTVPVN